MISQGKDVATVRRQMDVTDNTYYRWRKEYRVSGQIRRSV
ncbi:MAG: transposase [Fuerstiella sp.]|nr:transposase [Fuerstiella sp.]MCP4511279.1 transposase [Fuerstiella sp.]